MRKIRIYLFSITRRFFYLILGMTDQLLGRKNKIVVLCYHTVSDSNWVFDTELKDLEKQMKYMLTKYKPISMSDLLLFLNGKKVIDTPSFVVNFDDGYKSIMKSRSMFFKFNIKPIVFLIANKKRVDRRLKKQRKINESLFANPKGNKLSFGEKCLRNAVKNIFFDMYHSSILLIF